MKKSTTFAITGITLSTLVFGLFSTTHVNAVNTITTTNTSGQALEIGPPVINLRADPGTTIKTTISLRDISPTSLLVTGEIDDFVANGESGIPKIILDDTPSAYSFKSWVTPLTALTLKPKEIKSLTVAINVPKTASPGGYFGIVRFTGTPPDLSGTGVSLAASLGSLILLTVNGQAKENLSVVEFSASHDSKTGTLFEAAPIVFTERFKNSGNIQEEPAGLVTVKDMFGNVVATLGVNQPTTDILPNSIRKYESSLDSTNIGNKILFGLYHADLSATYGANKQIITSSLTFWVIPYTLIAIIIAALVVAFFVLRMLIRRYNRYILAQAKKRK
ncbi:hypothetical protein EPN95_02300 [Patescibacteria group bacterium]|nr:MAG: hypothetical protein EPN95_02300 [Patescibacteria group bacterium]